jgi:hypothetical protein
LSALTEQRCLLHADREAAARCPACLRFYCRECVTEHAGRMLCAACIARSETAPARRESSLAIWSMLAVAGLFFAWLVFYYFGMGLARVPAVFFGGTP